MWRRCVGSKGCLLLSESTIQKDLCFGSVFMVAGARNRRYLHLNFANMEDLHGYRAGLDLSSRLSTLMLYHLHPSITARYPARGPWNFPLQISSTRLEAPLNLRYNNTL